MTLSHQDDCWDHRPALCTFSCGVHIDVTTLLPLPTRSLAWFGPMTAPSHRLLPARGFALYIPALHAANEAILDMRLRRAVHLRNISSIKSEACATKT